MARVGEEGGLLGREKGVPLSFSHAPPHDEAINPVIGGNSMGQSGDDSVDSTLGKMKRR